MPTPDRRDIDDRFRTATRDVQGPTVRWNRVARKARRSRIAALLGFGCAVLALTVVIVGGVVFGKKAVDPEYRPPIISSARTTVGFGQAGAKRGHTTLAAYLLAAGLPNSVARNTSLREEGFVFRATLELKGFKNELLALHWRMRAAESNRRPRVATVANPGT